jgi:hypothetical protein
VTCLIRQISQSRRQRGPGGRSGKYSLAGLIGALRTFVVWESPGDTSNKVSYVKTLAILTIVNHKIFGPVILFSFL